MRVLVLGGWSPGPLDDLQWAMINQATFFEPSLHKPPAGWRWCLTWESALLFGSVAARSYLSASEWPSSTEVRLALILSCVLAVPLSIVLLVRGSIRRCIAIAKCAIVLHHIDVIVGFSWGGGVACWLLAERNMWRGPTLLLAPTIAAMSGIALLAMPRFLASAEAQSDDPAAPLVHIVHAMNDGFCPALQHHHLAATGAAMHLCDDIHIFSHPHSVQKIVQAFSVCVQEARRRRSGSSRPYICKDTAFPDPHVIS